MTFRSTIASDAWLPDHDWFPLQVPPNVHIGHHAFLDTCYGLAPFRSGRDRGLVLADGSGAYDRTTFAVGSKGQVSVGEFSCLNNTYIFCEDKVSIGAHCLIAWGVVITDQWIQENTSAQARNSALIESTCSAERPVPACGTPKPVIIEDNVWIGFGSVILPGVTLGHGCVVGSRSIIQQDVPPYAVVVGDPQRVLRHLDPTDADPEQCQRVVSAHLASRADPKAV